MEIQQTTDSIVDHLTTVKGTEMEIMANLASADQIDMVIEGHLALWLGSEVGVDITETFLRCTCSMKGRAREDLKGIGTTPNLNAGFSPRGGEIDG